LATCLLENRLQKRIEVLTLKLCKDLLKGVDIAGTGSGSLSTKECLPKGFT
jgi:hypothetical protein